MTEQELYERIAARLGVEHEGVPFPYRKRTRWNNRAAGPGRYPGRGVVRVINERKIQVLLRAPIRANVTCSSFEETLDFISGLVV